MADSSSSDLASLLNSLSNEISLKILKLYKLNKDGLNLTDTSKIIKEKKTTVKDHLKKLVDSNLIYIHEKKYYLSYFGALVLEQVSNVELLNSTRKIFGSISSEMIPTRFITKFIPHLKGVKVFTNQWRFMNIVNELIDIIKKNHKDGKTALKLIGWNSIPFSLAIMRSSFNNIMTEEESIKQFYMDTGLMVITDESFLRNTKEIEQVKDMLAIPEVQKRTMICQDVEKFNFMIVRYDNYITFFLNRSQEAGFGPYFTIRGKYKFKPHPVEIFEEIFEYFSKKSSRLSELESKGF